MGLHFGIEPLGPYRDDGMSALRDFHRHEASGGIRIDDEDEGSGWRKKRRHRRRRRRRRRRHDDDDDENMGYIYIISIYY